MGDDPNAPHRTPVKARDADALLAACRTLVGVSAHSITVVEDQVDLMQFRGLVILASNGSMSLGQLADAAHIHLTRASRMCDRMVKLGLIDRADDPADRRQVVLNLTTAGQELVDVVMSARRAAISPVLTKMPRHRRNELISLLNEFTAAAGEPSVTDLWAMGWTT